MADGGGGYKLDSTTAHSDTVSTTVGGNTGVSFGGRSNAQTAMIVGGLVLLAVVWLKARKRKGKG